MSRASRGARRPRGLAAVLPVLLAAACGPAAPDFGYPLDDVLRVNHVQMKGTHNSYHVQPPDPLAESLKYTHAPLVEQLAAQGVRQFELDVHYRSDDDRFAVFHLPEVDAETTCWWLSDCLSQLRGWSRAHPGHHPLVVFIEPKDDIDGAADRITGHLDHLDAEVRAEWGDALVTPDDVRGAHATLGDAVRAAGWPTLGATRGKALFVLLDGNHADGTLHTEYTRGRRSLDGRAMFVVSRPDDPYGAVLSLEEPVRDAEATRAAVAQNFLVRTFPEDPVVNGRAPARPQMDAALSGAAHMISSDFPIAKDGGDYFVDLVGGTPSRCHPTVAPPGCTADAIEGPAHLQPR